MVDATQIARTNLAKCRVAIHRVPVSGRPESRLTRLCQGPFPVSALVEAIRPVAVRVAVLGARPGAGIVDTLASDRCLPLVYAWQGRSGHDRHNTDPIAGRSGSGRRRRRPRSGLCPLSTRTRANSTSRTKGASHRRYASRRGRPATKWAQLKVLPALFLYPNSHSHHPVFAKGFVRVVRERGGGDRVYASAVTAASELCTWSRSIRSRGAGCDHGSRSLGARTTRSHAAVGVASQCAPRLVAIGRWRTAPPVREAPIRERRGWKGSRRCGRRNP